MTERMKIIIKVLSIIFIATSPSFSFAQQSDILLQVEGDKISVEDFQLIYRKNNVKAKDYDLDAVKEYLDLYINFKLKVKEAEALGMDTNQRFIKELEGYRKQLAQPYLTDNEVTEKLIQEAYERLKMEINAAHILVRVDPNASPDDTTKAYKKAIKIREEILNGLSFEDAAIKYSEDPSAKSNGGDLGYFTAFQMVYPFEDAAFNTSLKEVSLPVKTRFGYHLVYVKDKRRSRGEVRVAHILFQVKEGDEPAMDEIAKAKADEVYQKLQNGEDFAKLAKDYSDDKNSGKRGGELPTFGSGRMIFEFEEASFALQNEGDYSAPFKTSFGWHIVKLLEKKQLLEFEAMKKDLERKIERDGRAAKSRSVFITNLKQEYGFNPNQKNIDEVVKSLDKSFFENEWLAVKKLKSNKLLFTLEDSKYTGNRLEIKQLDFANFIENTPRFRTQTDNFDLKFIGNYLWNEFEDKVLMDFEDEILTSKHPDFNMLLQEYRDGILLFELMDQKVWSKAIEDTIGLTAFYEENKQQFMWEERAHAIVYTADSKKNAKAARKLAKKRTKSGLALEDIKKRINQSSELSLTIDSAIFVVADENIFSLVQSQLGLSKVINTDNKFVFVDVLEILPPRPKTIEEARGIITAAYQTQLEKNWLSELKNKYKVIVNDQNLKRIR